MNSDQLQLTEVNTLEHLLLDSLSDASQITATKDAAKIADNSNGSRWRSQNRRRYRKKANQAEEGKETESGVAEPSNGTDSQVESAVMNQRSPPGSGSSTSTPSRSG